MAINQHMQPAQTSLMQTYVPLPFKELAMVGAHKKQKSDEGELLYNTLDQSLLKVNARGYAHKKILSDYSDSFDKQLNSIYDKHGGDYMKMLPELKVLKNTLAEDVSKGNLATIIAQAEQAGLHDEGLVDLKEKDGGKYYDEDLYWQIPGSAGQEWLESKMWGIENIGTEEEPQWQYDFATGETNPYVTGEAVLPSAYSYTGHHQAAQEHDETKKVFDPIKTEVQQFIQDGMTIETQSRTKQRIYEAAMNDYGSLSSNYRSEIEYLNDLREIQDPASIVQNATDFLNTYYEVTGFDSNGQPLFEGLTGKDLENRKKQYKEYVDSLTLDDGETPSDVGRQLANINTVAQLGEKYVLGSTKIKNVSTSIENFSKNRPDKTVLTITQNGYMEKTAFPVITSDEGGETYEPIMDASTPAKAFKTYVRNLLVEYENMQKMYQSYQDGTGTYSKDMAKEKINQIQDLEYKLRAYKGVENSILLESALESYTVGRMGGGKWPNRIFVGNQEVGPEHWQNFGLTNVFFDEKGMPISMDQFMELHGYTDEMQVYKDYDAHLSDYLEGYQPSLWNQNIHDGMPPSVLGAMFYPNTYLNTSQAHKDDRSLWTIANSMIEQNQMFQGRDIQKQIVDSSGDPDFDEQISKALYPIFQNTGIKSVFRTMNGKEVSIGDFFTDEWTAEDYQEYLTELADKNKTTSFSIQATPSHTVNNSSMYPGGFQGMLTIPTGGEHKGADSEDSVLNLFFDMPPEYTERKLTSYPDGTLYKDYGSDGAAEYLRVNMEYAVQLDLDAAANIPGDRVPTKKRGIPGGAMFETGEYDPTKTYPLGHWYFETNPITNQPLVSSDGTQMDQFLFKPTEGMLIDVTDDGTQVFATGNEVYNADTQMQEVFNVFALNDPDMKWAFDMIFDGKIDVDDMKEQFSYVPGNAAPDDLNVMTQDANGNKYALKLKEGETYYPPMHTLPNGNTINTAYSVPVFTMKDGKLNLQNEELKLPLIHFMKSVNNGLETKSQEYLNKLDLDPLNGVTVTLMNGQSASLGEAIADGRVTLEFTTGDNLEIIQNNSNRDYNRQKNIYDKYYKKWVDGGKQGNIGAMPPDRSFHPLGQAIDISSKRGTYDIILVDRTNKAHTSDLDPNYDWTQRSVYMSPAQHTSHGHGIWAGQTVDPDGYGYIDPNNKFVGSAFDETTGAVYSDLMSGYDWPAGYEVDLATVNTADTDDKGYPYFMAMSLSDLKINGQKPFKNISKDLTKMVYDQLWETKQNGDNRDIIEEEGPYATQFAAAAPTYDTATGNFIFDGPLTGMTQDARGEMKFEDSFFASMSDNPLDKMYFKYSDLDFGQMPGEFWHWSVGENRNWRNSLKYPGWIK